MMKFILILVPGPQQIRKITAYDHVSSRILACLWRGSLHSNHHEKKNITYEPPMPKAICEEEMQSTHLDNNEVIIEYMTNAHGNKVKKLKPIFIKSELDREYTHHIESDDDLPAVPEENVTQKREVTVDSYSESIFSNDLDSSDDRTVTVDSNSSATPAFEEMPCEWETNPKGMKLTYTR